MPSVQTSQENGKKGGRPRGKKSEKTLERERVLAEIQQRTMKIADSLFNSHLHLARGQTFLFKIEKEKIVGPKGGISYRSKRPVRVESEAEIAAYLETIVDKSNGDLDDSQDPSDTYYFLTAKEPDGAAIDSMFDRTFGKSTQAIKLQAEHTISKLLDELE